MISISDGYSACVPYPNSCREIGSELALHRYDGSGLGRVDAEGVHQRLDDDEPVGQGDEHT